MGSNSEPFPPGIPWTPVMNSQNPTQQLALQVSASLSIAGALFIMAVQLVSHVAISWNLLCCSHSLVDICDHNTNETARVESCIAAAVPLEG
jgi:hypothetical protein